DNDGTMDLKAIKQSGGITIAQNESAKFQSMPRSAITEGVADMVLAPKEIARVLVRLSKTSILRAAINEDMEESVFTGEDISKILNLLKKSTGVDFSHYKQKTIKRRIIRRMLLYRLDDLKDYNQ